MGRGVTVVASGGLVDFNLSVLFRTEPSAAAAPSSEERLMVADDREDSAETGWGSSSLIVGADGFAAVDN